VSPSKEERVTTILSAPRPVPARRTSSARAWLRRAGCAAFGHRPDNEAFARRPGPRHCRCGAAFLGNDGSETHVRHVLSCFLRHHTYAPWATRDGHREYLCVRCGHPLLFAEARDPYAHRGLFPKKVRYLCNLFGHDVHTVTRRAGHTEYACHCGHSFLRPEADLRRVTHPAVCTFRGHFVSGIGTRNGHDEFVCRNCGHTFGFVAA
jgi:hypothetical protein